MAAWAMFGMVLVGTRAKITLLRTEPGDQKNTNEKWRAQLREVIIRVLKRQSSRMDEDFTDLDNTRVTFC